MRPSRLIPFLALALGVVAGAAPAARVEVVYVDPQKFSDVRDGYTQTDSARTFFLDELRRYIERRAAARLAEGRRWW